MVTRPREAAEVALDALCQERPELAHELRHKYDSVMVQLSSLVAGDGLDQVAAMLGDIGETRRPSLSFRVEPLGEEPHSLHAVLARLRGLRAGEGRYHLESELAHGGMGTVELVWDAALERHLARKTIRLPDPPEATPEEGAKHEARRRRMEAFFISEALVQAQLDHPGIVPVHELGLDEDGQVFFTMKVVQGETLRHIIKRVHQGDPEWSVNRAVGALLRVCEAVAYAHSKRVLHRDIKPDNVMVGRFGQTYLMDWGLAAILDGEGERQGRTLYAEASDLVSDPDESQDSWLFTLNESLVGTPPYMSPEVALGDVAAVDERSDVYSLGALLYHLLTGSAPYEVVGELPLPFTIISRVRGGPPAPARELAPEVPPTLLAICERALSREPEQRFPSAGDMARALEDYLEDISEAREEARRQAQRARLVNEFLLRMLGERDPARAQGHEVTVREVLDRAAAGVTEGYDGSPADEAELRATIGRLYRELGDDLGALEHLDQAHRLLREVVGDAHDDTLDVAIERALVLRSQARYDQAEAQLARVLELARESGPLDDAAPRAALVARCLDNLANVVHRGRGDLVEAEGLAREALVMRRRIAGDDALETAITMSRLANILAQRGERTEAGELFADVLRSHRRRGDDLPLTITAMCDHASHLSAVSRDEEALALYDEAATRSQKVLGDEHPNTLVVLGSMAWHLRKMGQLDRAVELVRRVLGVQCRTRGEDHRDTVISRHNLARMLLEARRPGEALGELEDVLERGPRSLSEGHLYLVRYRFSMGQCLAALGRPVEALAIVDEVVAALQGRVAEDHAWLLEARVEAGRLRRAPAGRPSGDGAGVDDTAGARD